MKPRCLLQEILLKKLHFTLSCLAVISSFELSLPSTFQATPQTASKSSTASQTVPKPATKSGITTSTQKKTASRSKKSRRKVPRGQRAIESARVLEIQNALAAAGYYKQEPNGQWDDSTTKAMSTYQQDNGFRTTGKPDALSLKKLGL